MAKHTPGRLEVSETYSTHNHPERFWNTPVLADGNLVAIAAGATEEESKANAIRLAALGDLLEACKHTLTYLEQVDTDNWPPALDALIRAAIAKAEQ